MSDNPFHRHSSLLGLLCSLTTVIVLGTLTHWRNELIAVYIIAFGVLFVLFARLLYGLRASRALDKERVEDGSAWLERDNWNLETGYRLREAYEKAQQGDAADLERLAEEERSS